MPSPALDGGEDSLDGLIRTAVPFSHVSLSPSVRHSHPSIPAFTIPFSLIAHSVRLSSLTILWDRDARSRFVELINVLRSNLETIERNRKNTSGE